MTVLRDWRLTGAVLAVAAWVVYGPALTRIFAADQMWYFAELGGESTLAAGLRHLDYAVSRVYWRGDELLFRPVTFAWLAVANWAFSYHHLWWNIANLAIHIAVAVALFRLLIAIRPTPLALPASALFLVFEPSMELVIWNHLGGYLLAFLGLAIGLRAFVTLEGDWPDAGSQNATAHRWHVVSFAAAFTFAALAHELVVLVAAVAAWMLVARHRRSMGWGQVGVLFTPVLTFILLYSVHALRAPRLTFIDGADPEGLVAPGRAVDLMLTILRLLRTWTSELMLPTALQLGGISGSRFEKSFELSWSDPMQILNGLVVLAIVVLVATSISRRPLRRVTPLLMLLAFAGVAYPALIAFGRGYGGVIGISYYAYPYGLLGVAFVYALVDVDRVVAWRRTALVALVWAFAGVHALGTWTTAWQVEGTTRAQAEFFTRVGAFVDAHRSEPGFSFSIAPHSEAIDPPIVLMVGYPDEPDPDMRVRRMTEVLFAPYYDARDPRYILSSTGERSVRR